MVEGTAPMPVCSVAPSPMKVRACSAMARSTSVGSASGSADRRLLGLDEQVDLVAVDGVTVLGREAHRAREVGRALHDEQALGVGGGAVQLGARGAGMDRERAPAVGVGRGGGSRHHARAGVLHQRREAAEVCRGEGEVLAAVAQGALDRAPEARQVVDVGVLVGLAPDGQQRAVEAQVLPVIAPAERLQERRGLAGAQAEPDRVGHLHARHRLGGGHRGEAHGRNVHNRGEFWPFET